MRWTLLSLALLALLQEVNMQIVTIGPAKSKDILLKNDVGGMGTDFMTLDDFFVDLRPPNDMALRGSWWNQWDQRDATDLGQGFHPGHHNWGYTSENKEVDRWWLNQKDVRRERIIDLEKRRNNSENTTMSKRKETKKVAITQIIENSTKGKKFQNNINLKQDKQNITLKATAVGLLGAMIFG